MSGLPGFEAAMRPLYSSVQRLHPVRLSLSTLESTGHYGVLISDNALLGRELYAIIHTAARSESESDQPAIP